MNPARHFVVLCMHVSIYVVFDALQHLKKEICEEISKNFSFFFFFLFFLLGGGFWTDGEKKKVFQTVQCDLEGR